MLEYIFNGDINDFNAWVKAQVQPGIKYVVTLKKHTKKRTINQNDQVYVWYEQLARELTEDSAQGWRRFCKLHFGVGILRAHDAEFRELYDKCIKSTLNYEEKLQAMDVLPVTSRMTTELLNLYLEAMQEHFLKRGVSLEFIR